MNRTHFVVDKDPVKKSVGGAARSSQSSIHEKGSKVSLRSSVKDKQSPVKVPKKDLVWFSMDTNMATSNKPGLDKNNQQKVAKQSKAFLSNYHSTLGSNFDSGVKV